MASIYNIDNWSNSSVSYVENDIVYYTEDKKYYYCIADHTSSASIIPTNASYWGGHIDFDNYGISESKPNFIWTPSYQTQSSFAPKINLIKFGDGYEQRVQGDVNNALLSLSVNFNDRSEKESRAILHFFDQRNALESFVFTPPTPYDKALKFVCREWSSTYNFYDNYGISTKFEQVPN